MDQTDPFLTVAEVALGFVGFVAIFVVLRDRSGGLSDLDLFGVRLIVEISLATLLFAFLPFLLGFFGLDPQTVWASCSGVYVVFTPLHMRSHRMHGLRVAAQESPLGIWAAPLIALLAVLANVGNVVGFPFDREVGPYFAAVVVNLLIVGFVFVGLILELSLIHI